MPKPFIAGNWKMHGCIGDAEKLSSRLKGLLMDIYETEIVIAPPFTALQAVNNILSESRIKLAGQDVFWEEIGAFTGEISSMMLRDAGCEYVIIGHSERRCLFHEVDEMVNRKLLSALNHGLNPILCVGENLTQREGGEAVDIVKAQIKYGLDGAPPARMKDIIIAYEPVWAIGTGRTATPEVAEEMHSHIRGYLAKIFGSEAVRETRIIYGGSVKPLNIDSLMAEPDIDGALVGGASLNAEDFARIVRFKYISSR